MIKVLEEKPAPRGTVVCGNCGSLLEYGNADLHKDYANEFNQSTGLYSYYPTCLTCPVCGCEVSAKKVNQV